ncbi:hypothetical protein ES703_56973 [subsurface metagenome]
MKKMWLICLLLCMIAAGAFTQGIDNPQILRELGLKEEEIIRIMKIQGETEKVKREAQIELNLYKAQLEKILFSPDVDLEEVEKILRASMEWKLKSELAEIGRRVEIRKIMGEERWEKFLRVLKMRRQKPKSPQSH